jgi:hypothetical protein
MNAAVRNVARAPAARLHVSFGPVACLGGPSGPRRWRVFLRTARGSRLLTWDETIAALRRRWSRIVGRASLVQ